jgi:uncharacterized protein (DUF2062 family)
MPAALKRGLKRGYFKFLRLVFHSADSHHKVAMGAFWGFFFGLTPTVGIQITGLTLLASFCFFLNKVFSGRLQRLQFNLPLAMGLTWISNPANMLVLYFSFFYMGCLVLPGYHTVGWAEFEAMLKPILNVDSFQILIDTLLSLGKNILVPMILGSLVIAIPVSVGGYFAVRYLLSRAAERKLKRTAQMS